MKTAIMALSAATLVVAAPVFAQSVSSKAPHHAMRAKQRTTHPGTYPDISPQAGGGGGGGGGGM